MSSYIDGAESWASFMKDCLQKIAENQHKSGWRDMSIDHLLFLLEAEIEELRDAVDFRHDYKDVIRECADVANFAMMIADTLRARHTPPPRLTTWELEDGEPE